MNKITDIFNLEKWRVMIITLITAALVLAGCQSQPVPSTATRTEIPATATLTPTNTPEPTATATALVVPENAIEVVGGRYAYVKNGNLMLLGADGMQEVKDPSFDVVFKTMDDAKRIFQELDPMCTKVTREDFFFNGFPDDIVYGWTIDKTAVYKRGDNSGVQEIRITGIPCGFARVENPAGTADFLDLGVVFLAVNGYDRLLPVPLMAFDKSGRNFNLVVGVVGSTPQLFDGGSRENYEFYTKLTDLSWNETQMLLRKGIMNFSTAFSVPPKASETFGLYTGGYEMSPAIDSRALALMDVLNQTQGKKVGNRGFDFFQTSTLEQTTGNMLDAVDGMPGESFFIVPGLSAFDLIITPSK